MNATLRNALALTVSLLATASAFADGDVYPAEQPFVSTHTRAEVRAEVIRARAAGTLISNELELQKEAPFVSQRSRAEVHAEAVAQRELNDAVASEPHGLTVDLAAASTGTVFH